MNHHPARRAYDAMPLESEYHVLTAVALNAAGTTLPARTIKDIASITGALLGTHITRRPSDRAIADYAASRLVAMTNSGFRLTEHFSNAWPAMSRQSTIQAIDAVVRVLLPLCRHNGLLSFLSHAITPDGGMERATAHVHRLLNLLHLHVRDTHYLGRTTSHGQFKRRAHTITADLRSATETCEDWRALGPPPGERAPSNRMSAAGISMFYASTNEQTAKAEANATPKPGKKVHMTSANWSPTRDLHLLDLCSTRPIPSFWFTPRDERDKIRFLHAFTESITQPVVHDGILNT
ncbi:MAG: hypothetical protein C0504_00245 [Candidatus Solibacter sp.]|nr:hypothetical protein [Candidatus Solibacter sp.]